MPSAAEPATGSDRSANRESVSPEQTQAFLSLIMTLSWWWAAGLIIVAVLSSVHIEHPASGGISVHVAVGTAALVAIALIWLPAVVRLLSLTGGGFKAFGIEASTGGIRDVPEGLIAGLARIRTAVTTVEQDTPSAAADTETVRAAVDSIASEYLGGTAAVTSQALNDLARRYEKVRATEPRSQERTVAMNLILNEARVRARASLEMAARTGGKLLRSDADGDRVVGLALLQQAPSADALTDVLRVFSSSRSAFEQYHAALAVKAVAPLLTEQQRQIAIDTLTREQSDPRSVGLNQDPFIPSAIASALKALGADSADEPPAP